MFPAYGLTVCVPSVFSAKAAPPRPAPEFRYCFSCNESVDTLRWDKHTRYTTHADNARRRRNLMDNSLKMDAPDRLPEFHLNGPSTLDQQFRSFMDQVYLSPEKRDDICKKMRSALEPDLRNAFGHFEVQCYGSMVTGLAFDGSDVDFRVVVASGGCDGRFRIWEHEEHSKVFRLAQQLYRDPAFANVLPLYAAKTPVLRALHAHAPSAPSAPEGRKVDVTFGFPFSLANTHIVRHYLNLNPRHSGLFSCRWSIFSTSSGRLQLLDFPASLEETCLLRTATRFNMALGWRDRSLPRFPLSERFLVISGRVSGVPEFYVSVALVEFPSFTFRSR